jgi:catechol 2,3-dioxygenase-like lactoylglutathione lyase family enzyme
VRAGLGWPTWVGVVVDDMEQMAAFYEALGLPRTNAGKGWIQFDLDGRTFEILERSELPEYDARRFQVGFDVADIESARAALIAAGAEAISRIHGGPASANRWCYMRDPEGNVFEITQRQAPASEQG